MAETTNRRRQYIINKVFQYKLIFSLVGLVALTAAVAHGLALGAAHWLGNGPASVQITQTLQGAGRSFSWEVVWISLGLTVLVGTVLMLFVGLIYSHRIAGPLFNLKRVMAKVALGDLSTVMHIRTKDQFHDVEEAFNLMVFGLNQRIGLLHLAIQELPEPHRGKLQKAVARAFQKIESNDSTPVKV